MSLRSFLLANCLFCQASLLKKIAILTATFTRPLFAPLIRGKFSSQVTFTSSFDQWFNGGTRGNSYNISIIHWAFRSLSFLSWTYFHTCSLQLEWVCRQHSTAITGRHRPARRCFDCAIDLTPPVCSECGVPRQICQHHQPIYIPGRCARMSFFFSCHPQFNECAFSFFFLLFTYVYQRFS